MWLDKLFDNSCWSLSFISLMFHVRVRSSCHLRIVFDQHDVVNYSLVCFYICYHIYFLTLSDDLSHFSAWTKVMSPSTPISWTLVWKSLVENVIFLERVCLHHCLRVYPFHYVFSMEFICWYLEYVQVKKNEWKKKVISACI